MQKRYLKFILFLMATVILIQTPGVFAEDKDDSQEIEELKPLEVKAARNKLPLEILPTSATIITREEIEKKKYINVEDMLREELGLDVVQSGAMGSVTTVFMRGAGSSSTLVMIDGIQINDNTTGLFNFAHIQPDNIERIEILRGPQSTLWGADAVGGVINLVTKRGAGKPSYFFTFEGGSFETFKEVVGSSGGFEVFDYSLTASRTDTEGFSTANEDNGNTEDDGYQNTSFSTKMGLNFLDDGRVEFIGNYIRARTEFDSFLFGVGPVDGPPYSNKESFYIATPITKSITNWWDVKFNPSVFYDELRTRNTTFGDSDIFNRTYTLDLQNNFNFAKYYSLILGGEYQKRNGKNAESGISANLENQSVYVQGVFNYENRAVLTGGFRRDVNSPFDDALTYKFEASYRFEKTGTRFRGAYATGFRAPTINDLFFPFFSNPALKPEESKSWEIGFDQSLFGKNLTLSSVYFDSDFDNLIQFSLATFMPENIAKAVSRGVETSLRLKLPADFSLSMNHTWNDAFNDITKRRLLRRAEHKFHANIQHNWRSRLNSLLGITYKSNTENGASGNTNPFVVVRTVLSYQVNDHLKFTLRGENIFDEDYEEIVGFGTADASAYAGFQINY